MHKTYRRLTRSSPQWCSGRSTTEHIQLFWRFGESCTIIHRITARADNGSLCHGQRVKWVTKIEWVTRVIGQHQLTHDPSVSG